MKSILSHHRQVAPYGLLLGFALLAAGTASAQNFVKNPDFEEPLGPDNWTVVYDNCDPADFLIADRTTMAHKDMVPGTWDGHPTWWSKFGGTFAPNYCNGLPHAYFKQVVTGLTPLASYACSAYMAQMTRNDNYLSRQQVWMEAWGGPTLALSRKTPYVTANFNNMPQNMVKYTVTNTASLNGQIEIRLHYALIQTIAQKWEYRNLNAFYDRVCVEPVGQPDYMPPYRILSFMRTNQNILLQWESVMNNRYRIEASTNLSDPGSWSAVRRAPNLDTNLYATGTNFTFQTNLLSLFSYDPSFDLNAPLFFRICSQPHLQ